jgi:hypothetical protein
VLHLDKAAPLPSPRDQVTPHSEEAKTRSRRDTWAGGCEPGGNEKSRHGDISKDART